MYINVSTKERQLNELYRHAEDSHYRLVKSREWQRPRSNNCKLYEQVQPQNGIFTLLNV
jgi:hypothetical protein